MMAFHKVFLLCACVTSRLAGVNRKNLIREVISWLLTEYLLHTLMDENLCNRVLYPSKDGGNEIRT